MLFLLQRAHHAVFECVAIDIFVFVELVFVLLVLQIAAAVDLSLGTQLFPQSYAPWLRTLEFLCLGPEVCFDVSDVLWSVSVLMVDQPYEPIVDN